MDASSIGRFLLIAGLILAAVGGVVLVVGRFVDLGNLPGDLAYKSENVRIYAPITTMIVLSIVLTILLNLLLRWWS